MKPLLIFITLAWVSIHQQGVAGALDDFESAKEKKSTSSRQSSDNGHDNQRGNHRKRHKKSHYNADDEFGAFMVELIVKGIWYTAAYGGETSQNRYSFTPRKKHIQKRNKGELLIPNFRFDFHYQETKLDIKSSDFRLEYGQGLFGVEARTTKMIEGNNVDQLRLNQAHFLYRMSFGNHVGINAGLGVSQLVGNSKSTSVSFAFPIYFHPWKHVGFEFKTGAHFFERAKILDLDYSILFTKKYFSLVLGYRELVKTGEDITGPYAGFSLHY